MANNHIKKDIDRWYNLQERINKKENIVYFRKKEMRMFPDIEFEKIRELVKNLL
jgi:hypothetical protein